VSEVALSSCPICGGRDFSDHDVLSPGLTRNWELEPEQADYISVQQGRACDSCGANLCSMTLAAALCREFRFPGVFRDLCALLSPLHDKSVLEINEAGTLTPHLGRLPGHRFAAYPGVDIQALAFDSGTFDLVVHSDTLEHVDDSGKGLSECFRVLKPRGVLAYTIPIVHERLTRRRDGMTDSFHGPADQSLADYRVVTEYGADFYAEVFRAGFASVTLFGLEFPASIAILARKLTSPTLRPVPAAAGDSSGERFIAGIRGDIELEHLHRYAVVSELVSGKDVLDIASGDGYGSNLLAESAKTVVGVDVSVATVERARETYRRENLRFEAGSCATIPLPDASVDVAVSFETIEHHDAHEEMLSELKRVLRPGGLLALSSPDKRTYSELRDYRNEFHVKELYLHELKDLVSRHFRHSRFFGQRIYAGSLLAPLDAGEPSDFASYAGSFNEVIRTPGIGDPHYFLVLASDEPPPSLDAGIFHGLTEKDLELEDRRARLDALESELTELKAELKATRAQLEGVVASLSWHFTAPMRWLVSKVRGPRGGG
jgi:ubiquinone/menaquinone biosynthesis C-methylase UbiE